MTIGIDISQIVYNTGVSRYTRELVRQVLRIDHDNSYMLFAGVLQQRQAIETYLQELKAEGLQFKSTVVPLPPKAASFIWNDWHQFPIETFIGEVDVFHTSNWTQPPVKKAKKVVTIHDLTPILYPKYHDQLVVKTFKKTLTIIEKECQRVIVDSKATKNDLLTHSSIKADDIHVVYLGASDLFLPVKSESKIVKVKEKYGIKDEYFLTVATHEPRKNLATVIEAFKCLNENCQLVLTGKYGWGEKVDVLPKSVITTGFIPDDDLPALYSGATAFVYVSEYEGFGLPVLEAMQCGCPVITSNVSSLPEVAGNAAMLIKPHDISALEKSMETVLTNKTVQKEMRTKSLEQANAFSWEKTAQETLHVYKSLEK